MECFAVQSKAPFILSIPPGDNLSVQFTSYLLYISLATQVKVSCATRSENKMKLIVFLATIVLVSAKSIKIDQLEYGFCGENSNENPLFNLMIIT